MQKLKFLDGKTGTEEMQCDYIAVSANMASAVSR